MPCLLFVCVNRFVSFTAESFARRSGCERDLRHLKLLWDHATLVHYIQRDGPLSVFRGLGVQVAGVAPEKAIKLTVNDAARSALRASFGSLSFAGELAAGVCAGACQVIVTNPLECVKVRLQTTNAGNCFEVVRSLGLEGLSTGALACAMRDASFSAILFPTYAHAKVFLPEMLHLQGAPSLFVAGLLSAAPAAFLTTPLDVVKTRQLERAFADGGLPSVGDVALGVYEEGPDVLFSGGWDNTVQIWDLRVGQPTGSMYGPHLCGDALDIKGHECLTGSWRPTTALQLWDVRTRAGEISWRMRIGLSARARNIAPALPARSLRHGSW